MKWIGQNIYDLVSRFRNDVYLEDISTGTIASGAHLGLDSNNKIVKAVDGGGDLTGITAGVGLSGSSLTGPVPTLTVDFSEFSTVTPTSGDFLATLDSDGANEQKTSTDALATLFAGGGLSAVDAVLSVNDLLPNVTALGTLTALTVDNIGIDGDTITASGDLAITATGNDITVDSDTFTMTSSTADQPIIKLLNTTDDDQASQLVFEKLRDDDGVASGQNLGEIWFKGQDSAQNTEDYAYIVGEIDVSTSGQESGQLVLGVASDNGANRTGFKITGGDSGEVDVVVGLGAASVTTVSGTLTMGSTAAIGNTGLLTVGAQTGITACANLVTVGTIGTGVWQGTAIAQAYIAGDAINGDKIADDAVDSEHYTDGSIDTAHIADDQVTFAKASGVTPNVFGGVIKLLPTDFMDNGDGGNTKFGIGYTDSAGTGYGMRVPNGATEMYAFVSIPEGMKAVGVDIFDKTNLAIEVFEVQINATTMVSKGSGNCNTTLDITDVNSTSTNMLAIEVTTTAVTDRVYGGTVRIAKQ